MNEQRVAFYTLGCKVNSFDTEAMAELFENAGYQRVDFSEFAEIYVVNTCTVTHLGDRKSRNMLRRARKQNPDGVIIAAGCYAQTAPEEVAAIPEVDLVLGTQDRLKIVEIAESFLCTREKCSYVRDNRTSRDYEDLIITENKDHTRAFLKIQEGCDQFCTYCIVPYARGRVRSRSKDSILAEVRRLVESGFMEIVLTGIHIASYGKDFSEKEDLISLIEAVAKIPGVERIRLGSLEPLILTEEAVQRLAAVSAFCPHFHLSLQSGSDTVLKRMHRHYTTKEYAQIVARIREYFDHPAITTDIMVGFPGETDREFEETLDLVRTIHFYQIHVFKYSRRKGTPAAEMSGQIDDAIKAARSQKLIALSKKTEEAFLIENDGLISPVLFEQEKEKGTIEGHTSNYIPVFIPGDEKNCGKILPVRLSYSHEMKHMGGEPV